MKIDIFHEALKEKHMVIALCGFMGAGKTTIGKRVAKLLNYEFIDLDDYIVEASGKSIPEIFNSVGEDGFRRIESESLLSVLIGNGGIILSLGGGTLERDENVKALKSSAKIIYLKVPFDICYMRIKNTERPLVKRLTARELEDKYLLRDRRYSATADIIIDNVSAKATAEKIIEIIKNNKI